ncbi:MAG: hypothetical protein K2N07_07400 [Desulfovibrio sp.]|nr:hypothetical protein [Desulfovibrio sp.]
MDAHTQKIPTGKHGAAVDAGQAFQKTAVGHAVRQRVCREHPGMRRYFLARCRKPPLAPRQAFFKVPGQPLRLLGFQRLRRQEKFPAAGVDVPRQQNSHGQQSPVQQGHRSLGRALRGQPCGKQVGHEKAEVVHGEKARRKAPVVHQGIIDVLRGGKAFEVLYSIQAAHKVRQCPEGEFPVIASRQEGVRPGAGQVGQVVVIEKVWKIHSHSSVAICLRK